MVLELGKKAFVKMKKLRLLKFFSRNLDEIRTKIRLPHGLRMLPDSLRYLFWDYYPNKFLPSKFDAQNIVEVSLRQSCIKQLKKEPKMFKDSSICLKNLKRLDLSGCLALSNLSAVVFDNMVHLCELSLNGTSVSNLPSSIENLTGLIELDLSKCQKLASLPDNICNLKSLQTLILDDCKSLQHLPKNIGNLESLSELYADRTSIKCVPSSIVYLKNIRRLSFGLCTRIKVSTSGRPSCMGLQLPPLRSFQYLIQLDLRNCNFVEAPSGLHNLTSLYYLDLSGNNFDVLPQTIFNNFSSLYELNLNYCNRLRSLPDLPPSLRELRAYRCTSLESIMSFETLFGGVFVTSFGGVPKGNTKAFDFGNCFKLKNQGNNILKSLLQGVHLREKEAQGFYDKGYNDDLHLELMATYPGSEIPEWFGNQTAEGNTITLQLPPPHCIDNYLGFAFCFIFSLDEDLSHDVSIHFRLIFQRNDEFSIPRFHFFPCFRGIIPSQASISFVEDHVAIGFTSMYDLISSIVPWPKNCNQIDCLVEFVVDNFYKDDDPLKVKKCAVRLVNVEGKT